MITRWWILDGASHSWRSVNTHRPGKHFLNQPGTIRRRPSILPPSSPIRRRPASSIFDVSASFDLLIAYFACGLHVQLYPDRHYQVGPMMTHSSAVLVHGNLLTSTPPLILHVLYRPTSTSRIIYNSANENIRQSRTTAKISNRILWHK